MAKKDNVQKFTPEVERSVQNEEVMYESEAYGSPQPDAGMETTVMKPVGMGGPVPIVAPKHNTVQLQPIIVPLAVVPYMTQDSDVLRTDGAPSGGEYYGDNVSDMEATRTRAKEKAKSDKGKVRIASLFLFVFSALTVVCYLLAYFKPNVFGFDFADFNVIGIIADWIGGTAPQNLAIALLYIISAGFATICTILTFIALLVGKLPAGFTSVLFLCSAATVDAGLIYRLIADDFVLAQDKASIVICGIATIGFIISVIVAIGLGKSGKKQSKGKSVGYYGNDMI